MIYSQPARIMDPAAKWHREVRHMEAHGRLARLIHEDNDRIEEHRVKRQSEICAGMNEKGIERGKSRRFLEGAKKRSGIAPSMRYKCYHVAATMTKQSTTLILTSPYSVLYLAGLLRTTKLWV